MREARHAYSYEYKAQARKLAGALYGVAYYEDLGECEFADLDSGTQDNYMADAIEVLNRMPHLLPAGSPEWELAYPDLITTKEIAK